MGEPALRDCDDPADLPLFAPVPASRPGRLRSTFSMRLDPAATRDEVQTSAASPPALKNGSISFIDSPRPRLSSSFAQFFPSIVNS